MLVTNLVEKLQKLNRHIYYKFEGVKHDGMQYGGIWLRQPRNSPKMKNLIKQAVKRVEDVRTGHIDVMLSNTPYPEVTEFEQLDPTGHHIWMRGWRSAVLTCVDRGVFTLSEAKKVFPGIGESDWDNLTYDQKEAKLKSELKGVSKHPLL